MLMTTAAVMVGAHQPVYQCGSSGANPVTSKRITELTGLVIRRHRKRLADAGEKPFEKPAPCPPRGHAGRQRTLPAHLGAAAQAPG
jgi:hypothetical protein